MSDFHQASHKLLVIPGPIEFSDPVLAANATPGTAHTSPAFIPVFGEALSLLRDVLLSTKESGSQPLLIAGSGTLGWDAVAANLIEQGEEAVVLNTGYFSDSFAECLEAYGAKVIQVKAEVGNIPTDDAIISALASKPKLLTITHVDTSTGVLSPAGHIASLVKKHSPSTLIALDAVCSVASEEIRFDDWGLDVVLSATQKGLGVPPGLSVVLASKRAVETVEKRKTPIPAYYVSWKKWIPIMQNYESGKPSYFATPPVQLVYALHTSLKSITSAPMADRFKAHKAASAYVKDSLAELGLEFVPKSRDIAANGMTAVRFPKGLKAPDVLPKLAERNIVVAAGLHKAIVSEYFRIGHMGITAVDRQRGDLEKVVKNIKEVLGKA
ncbi:alanine-glyoxylate transaminase/serine-glyoxylate transaminase/serine-pyruvate transaminase [Cryptococcus deuterogattii 99/473]|uniref:alanine--glyoxylate transaminase n=1 Tax=Cryptococcus deuterogattii Ram5 TaxID=1296110 RepID=A0A0D0T056_9TREE|nr:alanine-glyoxylate transaminase/serine-glyoxylate transaminase/serine-pyruvate transaminase [Cryptococcus deuterogattii LA55]KIR36559.1 alanine-glyoxylate transaminase/serine-glyoxylate transaminase/serine-pyruvate transaminase [Cryptococcus deuterogattii MMRL2647]KIR38962.1 alanine-glyoxylate transaminase/serine-glyoxylate transaminase/serine-pyruvate transaminase [Cryptococcus deuterogattii Ram5]KIR95932.1 alanine-glyoxylate transaminase/serine-glyoxylate transaminase/serine-pyruvate transa